MKFAKKMKLVPVGGREEPEIHQLSVLDNEMSTILKNPKLSTSAKMKLYHQVLMKNIAIEARLKQKSIENDNEGELQNISASAFNEISTIPNESKITDKIDILKEENDEIDSLKEDNDEIDSLKEENDSHNQMELKKEAYLETRQSTPTNTSKIKKFIENNVLRGPWMNFKMRSQPRINYFEKSDTSDNKEKKKNKRKNSLDLDPDYI